MTRTRCCGPLMRWHHPLHCYIGNVPVPSWLFWLWWRIRPGARWEDQ